MTLFEQGRHPPVTHYMVIRLQSTRLAKLDGAFHDHIDGKHTGIELANSKYASYLSIMLYGCTAAAVTVDNLRWQEILFA